MLAAHVVEPLNVLGLKCGVPSRRQCGEHANGGLVPDQSVSMTSQLFTTHSRKISY